MELAICTGLWFAASMDAGVVVSQIALLGFLLWAAADLARRIVAPRGLRPDGVAAAWAGSQIWVALIAAGLLWAVRADAAARDKALEMLTFEAPEALVVLLLLTAARGLRRPSGWSRLTPLVDRWFASRRGIHPKRWRLVWLLETGGWLGILVIFSALWLRLAGRWVGARADTELVGSVVEELAQGRLVVIVRRWVPLVLAPFAEEAIYRGYIQTRLALHFRGMGLRWGSALSIFLASAVWTLGHGGMIEPAWVKWTQIAGIGVGLGVVRVRLGLEACVVVHLLFNLIAVMTSLLALNMQPLF